MQRWQTKLKSHQYWLNLCHFLCQTTHITTVLALLAALNLTAIACNAGHAFSEAPALTHPFLMYIDGEFCNWWTLPRRAPIPQDILKVNKALQGHPEAPCLWHKCIEKIMTKEMGFQAMTNKTCLYHKLNDSDLILVLWPTSPTYCKTSRNLNNACKTPLNDLGVMKKDLTASTTF